MRIKFLVPALVAMLLLSGCGNAKTVACDRCGKPVKASAGSNVDDSWTIYCNDCEKELFGEEDLILDE